MNSGPNEYALMTMTRPAQADNAQPVVAFDNAADRTCDLYEVHIPGKDAFAFQGAPGQHAHLKITGTR